MNKSEIKMSSFLDVNAVIENCKKVSISVCIVESILNSIQAKATNMPL